MSWRHIVRNYQLSSRARFSLRQKVGLTLLAGSFLAALATPAIVAAISHQGIPVNYTGALCFNYGNGRCLYDVGGQLSLAGYNGSSPEIVKTIYDTGPNGEHTVSSADNWPFSSNNYDIDFNGEAVYKLQFVDENNQCAYGDPTDVNFVYMGACSHAGVDFVDNGNILINVHVSDASGQGISRYDLHSPGVENEPINLQTYQSGGYTELNFHT